MQSKNQLVPLCSRESEMSSFVTALTCVIGTTKSPGLQHAENSFYVGTTEQSNIVPIYSQEQGTVKMTEQERRKTGVIAFPFKDLVQNIEISLEDAAKNLNGFTKVVVGNNICMLQESPSLQDAVNDFSVVSVERSNIAVNCSQENGKIKTPNRARKKTGVRIAIPLEDILQASQMSLKDAAKDLNIRRSTLKRVCKDYDIQSWPPPKTNKVSSSWRSGSPPMPVDHQEQIPPLNSNQAMATVGQARPQEQTPPLNSDSPSKRASTIVAHTDPHGTARQDENMIMTVKARYGNDFTIKFRLSSSSGLVELEQQVAKRLNLVAGTYYIKYEDEDSELILIACDEDLQDYMHSSRSLGSNLIVVLLEPKKPRHPLNDLGSY